MLVTINTDASFHHELKYGSYAFWAVCNNFKITRSGAFKKTCLSSDDAESKCIINAIKCVLTTKEPITKIIVNTDSLNAIALIKGDTHHIRRYITRSKTKFKHIKNAFMEVMRKHQVKIEFRHVKAHSGVDDKRSYVNEWCDKQAKKELRKLLTIR